jgi:hypothetical protein
MGGLALISEPMFEAVLSPEATAAVWDVSARTAWSLLLGRSVQSVRVHYEPWDPASGTWSCRRLEIDFRGISVEIVEAEAAADGTCSRRPTTSPCASNHVETGDDVVLKDGREYP